MSEIRLSLTKSELSFVLNSVSARSPFIFEVEMGEPHALMWKRVMRKLEDAAGGRQKTLTYHALTVSHRKTGAKTNQAASEALRVIHG